MMDWQFWSFLSAIIIGFVSLAATVIRCVTVSVWGLRGWAEEQFNSVRENAHKILEKHEEKDDARHRDRDERLRVLERELTDQLNAIKVQLGRINRGGKHAGPDWVP